MLEGASDNGWLTTISEMLLHCKSFWWSYMKMLERLQSEMLVYDVITWSCADVSSMLTYEVIRRCNHEVVKMLIWCYLMRLLFDATTWCYAEMLFRGCLRCCVARWSCSLELIRLSVFRAVLVARSFNINFFLNFLMFNPLRLGVVQYISYFIF